MTMLVGNVSAYSTIWELDSLLDADVLRIDSELVQVKARFLAGIRPYDGVVKTNRIRVSRGFDGTTAASHLNGAALTAAHAFAGGGSDTRVTVDLSVAQLRALWTVPVQAIAAPGAGKVIWLKWMLQHYTFVSVAYAAADVVPMFEDSAIPLTVETYLPLDITESRVAFQPLTSYNETGVSYVNKAVNIAADPNAFDPGSSGNGTMRIIIDYEIVTL